MKLRFVSAALGLSLLAGCGASGTDLTTSPDTASETSNDILASVVPSDEDSDILARGFANGPSSRPLPGADSRRPGAPIASEVRTIDGSGNHASNFGSTELPFAEDVSRAYSDGIESPSGEDRPNPREVSNAVIDQPEDIADPGGRTAYLWLWGQFIDHDFTLTHENGQNDFPVAIPLGDPYFDPFGTGSQELPFSRSTFDELSGDSPSNPRAQVNSITSFLDGSMVYGSDEERATALRTFSGGLLATSAGELPPFNTAGLENAGGTGDTLFLCGDIRANENVLLTSMHTVFLREHNRIATLLAEQYPEMSDEELYQAARKRVGAIIQAITYNEYLPALLGQRALPPYRGYRPSVDPRIGILFSTAAYRLGHTQVGSTVPRLDENGEELEEGHLALADAFFNPSLVGETGISPLLRGAASEPAQQTDSKIVGDLRNFLFGPPGSGGLDLASLNIQRGRDHGLPDYNTVRQDFGLPPVVDFTEVTADTARQTELSSVYESPEQVDPWVGLLAEDPVGRGVVGPTLQRILAKQFSKLRDGDRFFYLNDPDLAREQREISSTTLAEVIERNSEVTGLQDNVFFGADSQPRRRPRVRQPHRNIPRPRF